MNYFSVLLKNINLVFAHVSYIFRIFKGQFLPLQSCHVQDSLAGPVCHCPWQSEVYVEENQIK